MGIGHHNSSKQSSFFNSSGVHRFSHGGELRKKKRGRGVRPFSRVVRGWKSYKIVRNYIQLNEKEARGEIRYQKNRLRGLSSADWEILWG